MKKNYIVLFGTFGFLTMNTLNSTAFATDPSSATDSSSAQALDFIDNQWALVKASGTYSYYKGEKSNREGFYRKSLDADSRPHYTFGNQENFDKAKRRAKGERPRIINFHTTLPGGGQHIRWAFNITRDELTYDEVAYRGETKPASQDIERNEAEAKSFITEWIKAANLN